MIPLTPALLVAAANTFVGRGPDVGDGGGQMVELFLRDESREREDACVCTLVHHVGYWSHYDDDIQLSSWPIPPAFASCEALAQHARRAEILVEEPNMGDLFLLYSTELKGFAHSGIIVSVNEKFDHGAGAAYICTTVEARIDDDHRCTVLSACRKIRWFSIRDGDRFIRWVDMELRAAA